MTSTFTLRGRRGTYGTGPISSRMCCRCPFRSRQGHFLHGRHVLDGRHVANIHEILTIFFAFLLVSFDLSCGQVPFRLHHAHAAASTRGKNIPHACSQHVRCPTFQYIHTYTHTHTHMHTYHLSHTIFLRHTPFFTYNFVTHNCFNFSILHHLFCVSFLSRPRYNIWCSLLEEVDMWGYPVL